MRECVRVRVRNTKSLRRCLIMDERAPLVREDAFERARAIDVDASERPRPSTVPRLFFLYFTPILN